MPRHSNASYQQASKRNRPRNQNQTYGYEREWRPRTHLSMHQDGEPRRSATKGDGESGISNFLMDFKRTISEKLNGLELGEIPRQEDVEQMERMRLKGKSIGSDTPTSKEKDRRVWNAISTAAPLSIREPSERLQSSMVRYVAPGPPKSPPSPPG